MSFIINGNRIKKTPNVMNIMLDENAIMPVRAHKSDAGWDLFSREATCIAPHSSATFDTGVHFEIPEGYVGFIKSKSGMNVKLSITSEGVIDSGYTGSIVVKLYNHSEEPVVIAEGQKITQIVFLPIYVVDELNVVETFEETERGEKGFGSSGK